MKGMITNQNFNIDTLLQSLTSGYEYQFVFNLLCCLIAALVIGGNRERKGKAAGISTHSLVIAGSMLYCYLSFLIKDDEARIAAQIIPGIGFLGAGLILKRGDDKISNLTTAASVWFSAAIGMAIGFGNYAVAGLCILYALISFGYLPHFKGKETLLEKNEEADKDVSKGN